MKIKLLLYDLWPTIANLARQSKHKHVAVAYLGKGATELLPLGKGDSLVVDMSEAKVKAGDTNPWEVEKYLKGGVEVYTCSDLHAKVYVLGKTLIVASANVSQHSKSSLIEAALLCQDREMLNQARGWLRDHQFKTVNQDYVEFCKRIYRPPPYGGIKRRRRETETPMHSRLWIIGVTEEYFSEREMRLCSIGKKKAEKELKDRRAFRVDSISVSKSELTESAAKGHWVVQILGDESPREVCPPSRIIGFKRYRNDRKRPRVFIYLEAPKRQKRLPWLDFRKAVAKVGLRHIGLGSQREIRRSEQRRKILGLWN